MSPQVTITGLTAHCAEEASTAPRARWDVSLTVGEAILLSRDGCEAGRATHIEMQATGVCYITQTLTSNKSIQGNTGDHAHNSIASKTYSTRPGCSL